MSHMNTSTIPHSTSSSRAFLRTTLTPIIPRDCAVPHRRRVADLQGAKLEVEAVVREACEQVLTEPNVPREKLVLRATALEIAAEAFLSIKKEGTQGSIEEEFVKVETPSSKGPAVPPRPTPASTRPTSTPAAGMRATPAPAPPPGGEEKQETLHAAYKACECCTPLGMGGYEGC